MHCAFYFIIKKYSKFKMVSYNETPMAQMKNRSAATSIGFDSLSACLEQFLDRDCFKVLLEILVYSILRTWMLSSIHCCTLFYIGLSGTYSMKNSVADFKFLNRSDPVEVNALRSMRPFSVMALRKATLPLVPP